MDAKRNGRAGKAGSVRFSADNPERESDIIAAGETERIRARIDELVEQLKYHSKKYYDEDNPEIADEEYDSLYRELERLEGLRPDLRVADSPTGRVGGVALQEFKKADHVTPMLSLNDVFDPAELDAFDARMRSALREAGVDNLEYVVEKKIDGLSVSLEYVNGDFVRGATRGDGYTGEDVTENLRTIGALPRSLGAQPPSFLELRGEVYLPKSDFDELNRRQAESGLKVFANPRNAAAGSLRQLDPAITASRRLNLFVFNVQAAEGLEFEKHSQALTWLKSRGFPVSPDFVVCGAIDEVHEAIVEIERSRYEFPYDIDGAVVKVNDLASRAILGQTIKAPRWAAAYKYPAQIKETVLRDIFINVGRTGVLTPNARLDAVSLAGTTVTRATLHNLDQIYEKDIRIGDRVLVRKAGDIIPEVVSSVKERRDGSEQIFYMPSECPVCGAPIERTPGESAYRCQGQNCPAQLYRRIVHFASRDAMNIDGMGGAVIETLLEQNFIGDVADIYTLSARRPDLEKIDRMGAKSVDNLLNAIDASRDNSPERLLFGLGIRLVGNRVARLLINRFKSIKALAGATVEELTEIPEIGEKIAVSLRNYMNDSASAALLGKLEAAGVRMDLPEGAGGDGPALTTNASDTPGMTKTPLAGLTFVVTGTLPGVGRREIEMQIESLGGKAAGSVSKKTSYVLAGEDAGSKLAKAKELGIPVINYDEFKIIAEVNANK